MPPLPSILATMQDRRLFGRSFSRPSWDSWRVVLAALFALPMSAEQISLYQTHTHRDAPPASPAREGWLVVGRRGGKSRIAALVAVYLATFRDYTSILVPGEKGIVMLIAADRRQARVLMRYILVLLEGVPFLAAMITRRTLEIIELNNGIVIEIHTASFRTTHGYTIVAAIADELAFWRDETSANPDIEIINAIRPAMATVPGALLLAISSPYARRGALWQAYERFYGKDDSPTLIWQAATIAMNPQVDPHIIGAAYEADEATAAAEYGAEFRRDLESFISREVVTACVIPLRHELPPVVGIMYSAFTDPAGGSGSDSFTLGITHAEHRQGRRIAVLDCVREVKPPFSPEATVADFADVLRRYRCTGVVGDRYAGEWPREQFRKWGIAYDVADRPRSDLYRDLLPLLNSGTVELLDHPRLITQLLGLERHVGRSGRDTIDHGPHGHDDIINAAAGALVLAGTSAGSRRLMLFEGGHIYGADVPEPAPEPVYDDEDEVDVEAARAALRDGRTPWA